MCRITRMTALIAVNYLVESDNDVLVQTTKITMTALKKDTIMRNVRLKNVLSEAVNL